MVAGLQGPPVIANRFDVSGVVYTRRLDFSGRFDPASLVWGSHPAKSTGQ
jgi:hypothetical protein